MNNEQMLSFKHAIKFKWILAFYAYLQENKLKEMRTEMQQIVA